MSDSNKKMAVNNKCFTLAVYTYVLTHDVVPLLQLCISYLLVHCVSRVGVHLTLKTCLLQILGHFLGIFVKFGNNWNDANLTWGQPEWPKMEKAEIQ